MVPKMVPLRTIVWLSKETWHCRWFVEWSIDLEKFEDRQEPDIPKVCF